MAEIQVFIRSEECGGAVIVTMKSGRGMRRSPELKSFGRVDAALLHGDVLRIAGVSDRVGGLDADQSHVGGAAAPLLSARLR